MINTGRRITFFIILIATLIASTPILASSIESLAWLPLLSANVKKIQPNKACPQNQAIDIKVNKTASVINSSVGKLYWDFDCITVAKSKKVTGTSKALSEQDKNKQIQLLIQKLSVLPTFELQLKSINLFSSLLKSRFLGSLSIQKTDFKLSVKLNSDLIKVQSNFDLQTKKLNLDATVELDKLSHYIHLTDVQSRTLNNVLKLNYQSDLNQWHKGDFKVDWQGEVSDFSETATLSMVGKVNLYKTQIILSELLFNAQKVTIPISENQRWNTSYIKLKNTQPVLFNYAESNFDALPLAIRVGKSNLVTNVERGKSKRIRVDKQKLPPLLVQLLVTGNENKLLVDWTSTLLNQKLTGNLQLSPEMLTLKLPQNTIKLGPLVESASNYMSVLDFVEIESGEIKLDLSAQYNIKNEHLSFKSKLSSDEISGKKDNILFDGITLTSHLDYAIDATKKVTVNEDTQKINIENIFVGIPIQALQLDATLNAGKPIVQHFKARLLGGKLDLDDFKVSVPSQTVLNLSGISLAEVIKYSSYPEIQGKAVLDGTFPLMLTTDGLEIENGIIFARAPGGYIKVPENTVIKAMGRGNPAFSFTMQLLSNFQFDTLQGKIGYTNDGESDLKVEIKGISPTVSGAQPVNFNYSHNENILKLLKSLRFNDELVRDIKERY